MILNDFTVSMLLKELVVALTLLLNGHGLKSNLDLSYLGKS